MTPEERAAEAYDGGMLLADEAIVRIAAAIRAAEDETREACAKLADEHDETPLLEADGTHHCCGVDESCGDHIAAAIRAQT